MGHCGTNRVEKENSESIVQVQKVQEHKVKE